MTVQESLKKFIRSRKLKGLSKRTIHDYEEFVGLFVKYIGKNTELEELQQEDIECYIEYQVDRKISKSTLATYIRHFKIYVRWICENYEVDFTYKTIDVPKTPKKNIRVYSDKEIMLIFESACGSEPWIDCRNKTIIAFMLDSGLRQGEIASLKEKDVYIDTNRMLVHGKGDKERMVPLGRKSIELYEEYKRLCPYESEFTFVSKTGEKMSTNAIKLMITKIANKLPFEMSSHKLRHNFATNYCLDMYNQKGQIDIYRLMTLLGHEEIETTRRYLHVANEIIASSESFSHVDKVYNYT